MVLLEAPFVCLIIVLTRVVAQLPTESQLESFKANVSAELQQYKTDVAELTLDLLTQLPKITDSVTRDLDRLSKDVSSLISDVNELKTHFKANCKSPWIAHTNSCLLFVKKPESWISARRNCFRANGDMVALHERTKNQFIDTYLTIFDISRAWIGLNDIDDEGEYRWPSGEELATSRWIMEEPRDISGDKDCVEFLRMTTEEDCLRHFSSPYPHCQINLRQQRRWKSSLCMEKKPFICEQGF